jgi:hypothetical protein
MPGHGDIYNQGNASNARESQDGLAVEIGRGGDDASSVDAVFFERFDAKGR